MKEVIGVRFRENGKIYFFNPLNYKIDPGRYVIVETQHGVEFGKVVLGRREVDETKLQGELKPIIRIATEADEKKHAENLEKNKKAMVICKEKIEKRGLEMKLIGAEYSFDNSKVLFYFTADGRVDFRELVKDLAAVFKTRIELRQVGVRSVINGQISRFLHVQRQMFPVHTGFLSVRDRAEQSVSRMRKDFSQTESRKSVQNSLQNG